ncbi:MAG: SusC/RagA family TonB-linked outer membrane protein, partial [Draconibacterium sp.]
TSNYAISRFTDLRQSLESYDYARLYNEALRYDSYISGGYTPRFSETDMSRFQSGDYPVTYPSTDWEDLILNPFASQFNTNLSISGGTPKVKYFVSAGMFSQGSLFKTEDYVSIYKFDPKPVYKRYNFRSNFDFEVTKRFTINFNVSSQIEERKGFNYNAGELINWMMGANPIDSPGVIDGKLITRSGYALTITNPIYNMGSNGYHQSYSNYLNGSVRFNYDLGQLLEGLSTHGTLSYQNYVYQDGRYWKSLVNYSFQDQADGGYVLIPNGIETSWSYNEATDKNHRGYLEFGFDYVKSFGNHNVTGMVIYKQSKYYSPNLAYLIPNGYQGVAGRLTYDFKRRYLAEVNIGYEGTENFIKGERFGVFPAASLGWVVSEENFFPKNNILSYLKVRGTIGQVGNDKIGNISDPNSRFLYRPSSYSYIGGYNFGTVGSTFNYYAGSTEDKIGNPGLTWERSTKWNVGFEVNLLSNTVQLIADWFNEKRDNILANRGTIPSIVGANLPAFNLGEMKNSGFEGEITYRGQIKKLNYWLKANYTYAHNVVEFMDEVNREYDYQYNTGLRYGQYFGLVADGFYNTWEEVNDPYRPVVSMQNNRVQPGDIRYKDINTDGIIDYDDWVPIGYSNFPEKIFGISFGGDFNGFDFSVLFQGAANVSMAASDRTKFGFKANSGAPESLLESWTQERYENGERITRPHVSIGDDVQKNNYMQSTFWIRDASYVRLKNVEIGYNLNNNLLNKWGISSVRLYINGSNLYTWCNLWQGVDPEFPDYIANSNREPYPVTSTYNFGFNINF